MMTDKKRYTILGGLFTAMGIAILLKSLLSFQYMIVEVMLGFVSVMIGLYYFYERGLHDVK